jgi:hypothetical protein
MKSINSRSLPIIEKAMNHFYDELVQIPSYTDMILIRNKSHASSEMADVLYIPDLSRNEQDTYYYPVICNSYPSERHLLIPGKYDYRLGMKYGAIYGQQMSLAFIYDSETDITNSDFGKQKLSGFSLLFNPFHRLLKPTSPISNHSPGSIKVSKDGYFIIERMWEEHRTEFTLFIANINHLI